MNTLRTTHIALVGMRKAFTDFLGSIVEHGAKYVELSRVQKIIPSLNSYDITMESGQTILKEKDGESSEAHSIILDKKNGQQEFL